MTLKQRPAGRDRTLQNDRVRRARELGIDPYPARCHAKTPVSTILEPSALEECWAAGWIRGIRSQDGGRSIVLSDLTGSLSIRVRPEGLSSAGRKVLAFIRPGDIIEARGRLSEGIFLADEVRLLAAGAEPEKAGGGEEGGGGPEIPGAGTLRLRASLLKAVRGFFDGRGFLEVETPALLTASDPAPHLDSFVTEYADARGRRRFFLQTSPELPMKRLLGAGHERIYQIAKFFRNGERTALHNPEFTGIEWYEAYADYRSAMETAETLVASVTKEVLGETRLRVRGGALDLSPPWERIRVRDAFIRHAGIDLRACQRRTDLAESARKSGVHVTPDDSWEDLFFKISLERVEPMLGRSRPTLLFDYPAPLALLAKRKTDDPAVAERFEVFAGGMELANGFTELNDPAEQRDRWERELDVRRSGEPDASPSSPSPLPPLDEEFLEALEGGVPPAAGVALGLDRWVMLLAGCADIGEVRCFAFDAQG